jgi:hypothetical protein
MTEAAVANNVTPITGIQAVQTFKTPDGKFFSTEREALAHMARGKFSQRAQAFVDAQEDWKLASKTRAANVICDFLAWEEQQA